jgi:D-allose transport system substrate-binding protein
MFANLFSNSWLFCAKETQFCLSVTIDQRMLKLCLLAFFMVLASAQNVLAADKYIFILPSLANPYWQTVKQGIEDTSKEVGVQPIILSAISDQAKEEHLNLCQSAISQRPSIIVLCTTTTTVGLKCLKEAQSHGIKVAVLDAIISVEEAKRAGINLSFSVGTNNLIVGQKAEQFLASNCKFPTPKILILEGMVGNTNSTNRVAGFKQALAKDMPRAKIINSISADWDRLKALNITADTLTRTPDLNVVYAANDMMALGAIEAIRAAGKSNQVQVIGVDGVPDARKTILAGKMTASVAQLPYFIGKGERKSARELLGQNGNNADSHHDSNHARVKD